MADPEPPASPVFPVDGNRLTPLVEPDARLDAVLDVIARARHELRLLYYIFASDACGTRVRDAAIAAARRGVAVSLLVDGFGSEDSSDAFFAPLIEAGATMRRFLPRLGRRYLLRNHQKLALADDDLAVIGGFNIAGDYFSEGEAGWRDFGMRVEGPAAAHLPAYFDALMRWAADPRARMRTLTRLIGRVSQPHGPVRWLLGGPTRRLSPWAHALVQDIRHARRLDIMAGYFTPSPGVLRRIGRVPRRGAARVITAARSDNTTTIAAARHTYARLLRHGVRMFEYQPLRLHTKLYAADDTVYVGSGNCDVRSLFLNMEIMLRIEDAALARFVREHLDREVGHSREAKPELLRERAGAWTRLRWSAAYFLVAAADFTVTRRLNFGPGDDGIVT